MAGRIQIDTTPAPFTTPLEVSRDGGATFAPLVTTTVGTAKRGFVVAPAATYGIGSVRVRPVGFPAAAVNNPAALIVAAHTAFDLLPTGDSRRTQGDNVPASYSVPFKLAADYAGNANIVVTTSGIAQSGHGLTVSYGAGNPSLLTLYATQVRPLVQASIAAGRMAIVEVEGGINDMAFLVEQGTLTDAQITAQLRQGRIDYHALAQADGARTIATTPFAAAPQGAIWTTALLARLETIRLDDVAWTRTNAQGILKAVAIADVASDYQLDAQADVLAGAAGNRTADGVHLAADGRIALDAPVVKAAFDIAMSGVFGIALGRPAPTGGTLRTSWLHTDPATIVSFAGSLSFATGFPYALTRSSIFGLGNFDGTQLAITLYAHSDAFPLLDIYVTRNGVKTLIGSISDAKVASGSGQIIRTLPMTAGVKTEFEIRPVTVSGGVAINTQAGDLLYFNSAAVS